MQHEEAGLSRENSSCDGSVGSLDSDLWELIFSELTPAELVGVQAVCKRWQSRSCNERLWRAHVRRHFPAQHSAGKTARVSWRSIFRRRHQEEVDAEEVSCDRATAMHARTHMHTHVW